MRNLLCKACRILLTFGFLCFFSLSAYAEDQYTIIDLGALEGGLSSATDINNSNQIVGCSNIFGSLGESIYRAFLWQNGTMQDLGVLGSASDSSSANAINDSGQIVGYSGSSFGHEPHALLWQNGTMTDLGTLEGKQYSYATAINNSGQVVGDSYSIPYTNDRAFLWQNGAMQDLGGSRSIANDINDHSVIAGTSDIPYFPTYYQRAVVWNNGTIQQLGTLTNTDGTTSAAYAINNSDQVVGSSSISLAPPSISPRHAFLWQNGTMQDLGTLGGASIYPNDINNFGKVVGTGDINYPDIAGSHAFLWENGVLRDLNTLLPFGSGWRLTEANAINDAGWIVGAGYIQNQGQHAYLMKPNVVPEPLSCILFLAGGGAFFVRRRFLKKV